RTLRQEDGLNLRFEKLEVQLRRGVHGRMRLLDCESNRHQDTGAYRRKQNSSAVENLCQIHNSSTVNNRCCSGVLAGRYFESDLHSRNLLLQGKTFAEPVLLNRMNAIWRGVYERLSMHAKVQLA